MVFNTTFNNISVILWRLVLLVFYRCLIQLSSLKKNIYYEMKV